MTQQPQQAVTEYSQEYKCYIWETSQQWPTHST